MPQILIVDEHGVSRRGLRWLIEQRIRQASVTEAPDLPGAFPLFECERAFDLVLIEANNLDGHTRATLAKTYGLPPITRLAVLSAAHSRKDVLSCLADGFHGFIDKQQDDDELVAAIADLVAGRIHVPTWIADSETAPILPEAAASSPNTSLTPRQRSVLSLVAQGLSNKEIARHLRISEGTTKIHTAALLRALGVRNRAEAAAKAGLLLHRPPDQHEFEKFSPAIQAGAPVGLEPLANMPKSNPRDTFELKTRD